MNITTIYSNYKILAILLQIVLILIKISVCPTVTIENSNFS